MSQAEGGIWDQWPEYGDVLYERAVGQRDEMECSKAICDVLAPLYEPGMKVLDVGCGAGHYYTSLAKRVAADIDYQGVDITPYYVELARKAHPVGPAFDVGDVNRLEFGDGTFDIVFCSNVIMNLPPPPTQAFRELLRVAKKHVVIRALFGERNYIIKELRSMVETGADSIEEADLIDADGATPAFHYQNLYTEAFYRQALQRLDADAEVRIERDTSWRQFDNRSTVGPTATRVVGDMQVSGNLIFDWRFITIAKR